MLSSADVPIEDISHLVGHSSTNVTEKIYRKELRPVLTRDARAMDQIFPTSAGELGSQFGSQGLQPDTQSTLNRAQVGPDQASCLWAILGSNQ